MEHLEQIISTIEGLKLQAKVATDSNGDNSKINRKKLKEAHSKMNPKSLQDMILKDYMMVNNISSYIDINTEDFKTYFHSQFAS